MELIIASTGKEAGRRAAALGAARIRQVIRDQGSARLIVATGASQFAMLENLIAEPDIAWDRITVFHLDEYVGLPITHPASFRLYLWRRFHSKLPIPVKAFHYIAGDANPEMECQRVGALIEEQPIDVCFAGIGENAHLAFNDPPADFETETPFLIVDLDEACRRQQLGEGWFSTFDEVPRRAISMSINQILKSKCLIVTVPDERKANAVKASIEGPITNQVPASKLQSHPDTHVFLDDSSASLLNARS